MPLMKSKLGFNNLELKRYINLFSLIFISLYSGFNKSHNIHIYDERNQIYALR